MSSNPFAALFSASEESIEDEITLSSSKNEEAIHIRENLESKRVNEAIEEIFGFTINKNRISSINKDIALVFLEEFSEDKPETCITIDLLGQALFERLMLDDPKEYVYPDGIDVKPYYIESRVLIYLFNCYETLRSYEIAENIKDVMKNFIIQNAVLLMQQPVVFIEQNSHGQCIELLKDFEVRCDDFFEDISNNYITDEGMSFSKAFKPVLSLIHMEASKATLLNVSPHIFRALEIFTLNDKFANALLDYCMPSDPNIGLNYANTLFGALLTVSILPKSFGQNYDYFDHPMEQSNTIIEGNLWSSISHLNENMHFTFMRLLRLKEVKSRTLKWIAQCLKANANRGKLWNSQVFNPAFMNSVSDGFMINLSNIVLRLCQPFCVKLSDKKILRVDPTYCAVQEEETERKMVNMQGLSTETCLIPFSSDEIRLTAEKYNFVTECFFLAHRTLDLGFRICVDHLVQLNQDLSQIQRSYNDAMAQAAGASDIIETIKTRLEDGYKRYRSLRAVLIEPNFLTMLAQFHKATATWLVQVCLHDDLPNNCFAPLVYKNVVFPLPEQVPDTLKSIPEFIVENTVGFLSFLRRFYPQVLEEQGTDFLNPILTMVLTFMGSPERMRNPHLRARMAECLEALLPDHKDYPGNMNPLGKFQRENLFKNHPHRKQIVESLLNVFVSIEMTGQSVQFEQKFNYRRPMYIVMDYLWQLEEHRQYFRELAVIAEENMNAVTPPLFLRFVNLLMNDAVFLLDESLSNMAQIRTMQTARENGEWNNLPAEERTQNQSYISHLGTIARFDNILGRETIHTLELLTSEISIVFTHTTMVDRVAAMLNYFLYNLVGPNKKNFKVKDQKDYEFDPANTVLNICKIYVHLFENDSFCLAISQDGRSYNPQLFKLAEDVLVRIGGGGLISEVQEVAEKVSKLATQREAEDEILSEAPEEFLDPIMSTLMTDPVILPSSKQIVDRTTIARHILSDQTDPFNRSPLTMDQLIPATDLYAKIQAWISERKKEQKSIKK